MDHGLFWLFIQIGALISIPVTVLLGVRLWFLVRTGRFKYRRVSTTRAERPGWYWFGVVSSAFAIAIGSALIAFVGYWTFHPAANAVLVERNLDLCSLHSASDIADGQHVRIRGIYESGRHGSRLMRLECQHDFVLVDYDETTPLGHTLMVAGFESPSQPPLQSIDVDASGVLHRESPLPAGVSTDALQSPIGLMFEITDLHSVTRVNNDLKTGCWIYANATFCDCLQRELGPQATADRLYAVLGLSFPRRMAREAPPEAQAELQSHFRDPLSHLPPADRVGFNRCMPSLEVSLN